MSKAMRFLAVAITSSLFLSASLAARPAAPGDIPKNIFERKIPNIPGKSVKVVEVTFPPGARSAMHTHAPSAFIYAYVIEGKIINQIAGEPKHTYGPGDSFYEDPGAHHILAENVSKTKPARFIAVFVVDSNDTPLTIPDKKEMKNNSAN